MEDEQPTQSVGDKDVPTSATTDVSESVDADPQTDKAVDDIMKKDGDDTLKAQDEIAEKAVVMKATLWERCKNCVADWWSNPRKRWITIGAAVVVVAALFAVPFTRYNILGLVLTAPVTVQAVDSKTGAPVSGVEVTLAGKTAQTEANGKVVLRVHTGSKKLQVAKKYYTGTSQSELVALSGNNFTAKLVALGHQVNIKVVNKITGKPVASAVVSAGGAKAKTNDKGLATLVISSSASTQTATVALSGYNTANVTITATGDLVKNTFSVVPAGKLYLLSNLSGNIDVVKTDLDGANRQTVLAGTGSEDKYSTSLLASRDWKYLALLSKRSGDNASLYLIDTTNGDKLTTIDEGDANFSLIGWNGDRFIYKVDRNSVNIWQPNKQALKSFDPTTGHTLLLDQTQGAGTDASASIRQQFDSTYLIGDQVVYAKDWYAGGIDGPDIPAKAAELDTIGADGSGHKVLKSFSLASSVTYRTYLTINPQPDGTNGLYIEFDDGTNNFKYYTYEDGKVTEDTTMTSDKFSSEAYNYATYLLSPSGSSTFWTESRDGKNTLFVGDANAKNQKQVATLSEYSTYGWYTDNYLLVSKNSSELYVMPAIGGTPLKITDYYKPAINYNGYGGGYGGL